ncbi:hypothetical protein VSK90_20600 [Bacillus swezeyi]
MIGLQIGAVEDEYDMKYWGGVKRELDVWNAWFRVPDDVRDIGEKRMMEWIDKISYGNRDISEGIDLF